MKRLLVDHDACWDQCGFKFSVQDKVSAGHAANTQTCTPLMLGGRCTKPPFIKQKPEP